MDITIRVAGQAGQGVKTTGSLLEGALARLGLHVFSTQSYMSRIRGGLNWFDIRLADGELFGGKEQAEVLIALTRPALEVLKETVSEGGKILFDGPSAEGAIAIEFTKVAKELTGSAIMANTVAGGAVFALLGYDVERLCDHLRESFASKGEQVVGNNLRCARRGAELVGRGNGFLTKSPSPAGAPPRVTSGAEAIALGAATAGVKFYTAYPMTPSTPVLHYLAGAVEAKKFSLVVEQAEDEIAAINMVCGAAYAGVPAMTGTSGGGFALMVEGVSLAGMLELPATIFVGMRPGPATGLPTRTAQQDLQFVLYAGHGEFPRAIYAPGTIQQCYELTHRAIQIAHKYQTPTFILADQFLADAAKNIPPLDQALRPVDRHIAASAAGNYARYALAEGGVSPRAIPGGDALVVVDSDEHTPDGHLTEDFAARLAQQDKRMSKLACMTAEAIGPTFYGPADAPTLLVCWGSTYGPAREAVDSLIARRQPTALLHFSQVWPIDPAAASKAIGRRQRIVFVEGNQTGQFLAICRQLGLVGACEHIGRYDGLPFTGGQIAERLGG
jgi:2-oxoglutarate ferredoxin oxidoreductase subunit alpha